jgi:hypothetical protein
MLGLGRLLSLGLAATPVAGEDASSPVFPFVPDMTSRRRADLDAMAYELRRQGLTFRAIAERLGVTDGMAWRRVVRHERLLREQAKAASRPQSSHQ